MTNFGLLVKELLFIHR